MGHSILQLQEGLVPYSYSWDNGLGSGQNQNGVCDGTFTVTVTDDNGCVQTSQVTTNPGIIITALLPPVAAQCLNGNTFSFNGSNSTISSGSITSYNWDFGDGQSGTGANPSHAYSADGTYTVTLTVSDGDCFDITTLGITVWEMPVPAITGTDETCAGLCDGLIDLTVSGSGGYSYSWDNGAGNNQDPTGLCANTYNVLITDINGCQESGSITIGTVPELITADNPGTIDCFGGTTTVVISATGGTAPYSGDGTFTVSAGPYSYTVTDANNCTSTVSGTITEPNELIAADNPGTIDCFGGTTTIVISATGGTAPYSGDGTFTVSAGPYSYTVTDANNCTSTVSGTITEPNELIAADNPGTIDCFGGTTTIVISATGGTAPYSGDGTFTVSAGPYSYTVTDANNCTSTVSGTITEPNELIAADNPGTIDCFGGTTTVVISATGGTAPYSGDGTFTVSAGPYSYTVTDANNCTSTVSGTITEPNELIAADNPGTIDCFGGTTTIVISATGGTAPYSGDGTFTVSAGPYSYTVTDANNCTSTVSGTITEPNELIATDNPGTIDCFGGTTTIVISATGGTAPYSGDGTFTVSAGPYSYTVTDANNCTSTVSGTITEPNELIAADNPGTIDCFGGTNTVVISATGGTAPYSGDGTFTVSAGPYSYTVTDANNCTSTVSGTITEPNELAISLITSNDATCGQDNGSLEVLASGGTSPYLYDLGGSQQSNEIFNALFPGVYDITVTDANGCTQILSVPIADLSGLTAVIDSQSDADCFGNATGTVSVTGSGSTAPLHL